MFRVIRLPVVRIVPVVAVLAFVALLGRALTRAPAAAGGRPPSSACRTWALVADSGWYVSVELQDTGDQYGMLRARSVDAGAWETFELLVTGAGRDGRTVVLRSRANGRYVSAEIRDRGDDYGMLRARARTVDAWEQFRLVSAGSGEFALQSLANHRYVGAELANTGSRFGMLRARASRIGSWERLKIVELPHTAADASSRRSGFDRPDRSGGSTSGHSR